VGGILRGIKRGMNTLNSRGGRRRKFSPEERARWVKKFLQRQSTVREFARQHGLGESTLYQWAFPPKRRPTKHRPLRFEELTTRPVASGSWSAEVQLANGTQLRWNSQADLAMVQEVLQNLRQPC